MTTCNLLRDYTEFIDAVLLFRAVRDMDTPCSPGPPPELWLDKRLDDLATSSRTNPDYYTPEVVEWLTLASKMADLIDDRKQWLLEEIEEDLKKAQRELPQAAA